MRPAEQKKREILKTGEPEKGDNPKRVLGFVIPYPDVCTSKPSSYKPKTMNHRFRKRMLQSTLKHPVLCLVRLEFIKWLTLRSLIRGKVPVIE